MSSPIIALSKKEKNLEKNYLDQTSGIGTGPSSTQSQKKNFLSKRNKSQHH